MSAAEAVADTSLFVALEQQRPLRAQPPHELLVSVVTLGELEAGVLAAPDLSTRARRLRTLRDAASLEPLVIDQQVAEAWARLRVSLREAGRSMPVNDSWIAATALALGLPVATQDDDYTGIPDLDVILL